MKIEKRNQVYMFLIGLGSATKVYLGGAIAFSEILIFMIAPFLCLRHWNEFKRDGFAMVLVLSLFMIMGCFVSCKYNGSPMFAFVKSSMTYYSIFASIVVFYILLRESFSGIGCFFIGVFLSQIIAIFAFDPRVLTDGVSTELIGQISLEEKLEGVLFWFPKITRLLYLPLQCCYLSMPISYSIFVPIVAALVSMTVSISGRGAAAAALFSCIIIFYCRKSRLRMKKLSKHFYIFIILLSFLTLGMKSLYSYSAKSGLLGEAALGKYNLQTGGDDSFMRILIGGRTEFFIAIRAMLDSPFFGVGPYALDRKGYTQEFLIKYGTEEDFERYKRKIIELGRKGAVELLPQHSVLTQFWGHAGIVGLLFCLYFLFLVYQFFRKYLGCIPQWLAYFSIAIPPAIFTLFFNPYTDRLGFPLLITCLLLARAVGRGQLFLPYDMEVEARKYE